VERAPAPALWVDPNVHAAEVARFRSKIVAAPRDGDCSIWIGSIGADGYGRNCVARQRFPGISGRNSTTWMMAPSKRFGSPKQIETVVALRAICYRA